MAKRTDPFTCGSVTCCAAVGTTTIAPRRTRIRIPSMASGVRRRVWECARKNINYQMGLRVFKDQIVAYNSVFDFLWQFGEMLQQGRRDCSCRYLLRIRLVDV